MGKFKRTEDTPENRARIAREIDWQAIDALSDDDIAQQAQTDPDTPPVPEAIDIHAILKNSGAKSTNEFAKRYNLSRRTLEQWLAGRRTPDQAARTLLRLIEKDPKAVENMLTS